MGAELLRRVGRCLLLAAATACSTDVMSPIRNLGEVGEDPYLVFVAQAPDGASELYVSRPDGRNIRPVTYSPAWETRPVLSPDGAVLAFLRSNDTLPETPRVVWVSNLLNGSERRLALPGGVTLLNRLAWSEDGQQLIGEAPDGALYRWPMPPAKAPPMRLSAAAADSLRPRFDLLLGDPPFARVVPCVAGAPTACALLLNDTTAAPQPLADFGVRDAVRWRGDSVAYLIGDSLRVRPLGRGRERRIEWAPRTPVAPRQFTLFPGKPRRR